MRYGISFAMGLILTVACTVRDGSQGPSSSGPASTSSTDTTASTSSSDADSSSNGTSSSSSSSGGVGTTAPASTGSEEERCEPPPEDFDTSSYNHCTIEYQCGAPYDGTPDGCGINGMFDAQGCARFRCATDSDCELDEVCRDLVACVAPDCVPWRECYDSSGRCECLANESCEEELFLCFRPEELDCNE